MFSFFCGKIEKVYVVFKNRIEKKFNDIVDHRVNTRGNMKYLYNGAQGRLLGNCWQLLVNLTLSLVPNMDWKTIY